MSTSDLLTLVLVGPMGAGKTSVGRRVARELSVPFTDTDKRIAAVHGPITEIFANHGEAVFRAWERDAVAEALRTGGVVSLGGGAVTSADTRALLANQHVVYLTVTAEAVRKRISGSQRPLLNCETDPVERWQVILAEREHLYQEVATHMVSTSRRPMSKIAAEIAQWRREQR